jgi:O-antigen/teichoic acid export membrane protein
MRGHISNAAYGVLDYAAYPIAMLAAAPALLRHLGVAQYGVWVVCSAAVSTGGIIASGFGDANIQHVATMNSLGNRGALLRAVRSMMGINLLLGTVLALASFALVPALARHVVSNDLRLQMACVASLRIACVLMLVRAIESVCISTQRAFERYGEAVRISLVLRVLTIAIAVAITREGFGVFSVMMLTGTLVTLGTIAQIARLRVFLNISALWPSFDRAAASVLFGFGIFSWMQAVSGVVFSQADRLILGASLGAATVTAYALCVQMAQPIYGIVAAGLHFLFPYLAARQATTSLAALRRTVMIAFGANVLFVLVATAAELLFGIPLLRAWVGTTITQSASGILAPIVWSFALLGLSVTGYYAMLALGRVKVVTWVNLLGGAAMLALMTWLLPRTGIRGIAFARVAFGATSLAMYIPLVRLLRGTSQTSLSPTGLSPVCEDL